MLCSWFCSLDAAGVDVLALLLARQFPYGNALILPPFRFLDHRILREVIVRKRGQCPLLPRSSFIPITGSGASGWSSLARLLLSRSSFLEIAWLPSLNCSCSFMPACAFWDCGSCGDRFTAWSSLGRPSQPGVLSGAFAKRRGAQDRCRAEAEAEPEGGVMRREVAVLETETSVQGSRGMLTWLGWVGLLLTLDEDGGGDYPRST